MLVSEKVLIKRLFLQFVIGVFSFSSFAQPSSDTVSTKASLKEVTVCDHQGKQEELFNFYRNNKSNTTEEILSRMPGVSLIRRGNFGMEPILRGYSAGQINLTLDGMKIMGACTDRMDPATIYVEPANLQSLQVGTGTSGASMGSSLGGSINMQLKAPEFITGNKPFAGFNSSFGSVNQATTNSAFVNLNSNKIAWRTSVVYRHANDYKTADSRTILHSGYEKANIATALLWKISEHNSLKIDYLADRGWNIGFPALTMDVGLAKAAITSLTYHYQGDKSFISKCVTKAYFNQVIHSMDDTHRDAVPMHMDMPGKSETLGAFSEVSFKRMKKNYITARMDVYQSYTRADMTMYPANEPIMYMQTLPDNYRTNSGFFVKDEWLIDSLQQLTLSARIDLLATVMTSTQGGKQWSIIGNFPLERTLTLKNVQLGYTKMLSKTLQTNISMGLAERAPTPNEWYGFYLFNRLDNFDYLGNMNLRSELATQMEWSLTYSAKKTAASFTPYFQSINQYILGTVEPNYSPLTFGALGVKTYKNLPYAFIYGTDLTVQQQIKKSFHHLSTAKITIGRDHLRNFLPQMPPLKCIHTLRYNKMRWLVQGETEWALPQYRNLASFGERETGAYMIFNLRIGYKFIARNQVINLGVAIENITDRLYREHLDFNGIPRPGRNFSVTLSYFVH